MRTLEQIKKRKKVIIISVILAGLLGLFSYLIIQPVYKATVEIAVNATDKIDGLSKDNISAAEYLKYQAGIVKSNDVVDDVIEKLHLRMSNILDQKHPRESFLGHINVEAVGNNLIKITAIADTPQLAVGMAFGLANSFLEFHKDNSFFIAEEAIKWLSTTSMLAKELSAAENNFLNFLKENNMQDPQEVINVYPETIKRLDDEKIQVSAALQESKGILEKLNELTSQNDLVITVAGSSDQLIKNLLGNYAEEYNKIQFEMDNLLKTYQPNHPKIVELSQQRDFINKDVNAKMQDLLKKSKDGIDYAEKRIPEIDSEVEKKNKEYSELLAKKKEFDMLKAGLENATSLYEKAQEQLKSGGISVISVSMIGSAQTGSVPVAKIKPFKLLFVIFLLSGFIIGVLMALFLERSSMQHRVPAATN
ncbi:MAG: Wzz/FepE/Etk N-terminal domain-containing protein [Candidatus Omnitrophota bacterium]